MKLQQLIKELRELREKATPGTWLSDQDDHHVYVSEEGCFPSTIDSRNDRIFICKAANSLNVLLDVIEAQRQFLETLQRWETGNIGELAKRALADCDRLVEGLG